MKGARVVSCLILLLAYVQSSVSAKMNVASNNSAVPRIDGEDGSDEKVITCVTKYVIKGDLEIDDGGFCSSNIGSESPPGSCNDTGANPGNYCDNYYDITLLVEESSFIQKDYWKKGTIPFLESMVRNARVSKDKAHMSIVLFARDSRVIVPFTDELSQDKDKLIEKVRAINDVATSPDTLYAYALEHAFEHVIFGEGTRKDAPKVVVLFYYGFDYGANKSLIPDVVEDYKKKNIKLVIVGIALGNRDNAYLLGGCAIGDNNCANVIFKPWDFVIPAAAEVKNKICNKDDPASTN
ncbi:von Willebrand factor A domain-related protein [Plasmodium knowlesi strain H]|uniref:von Willebrand factor A domain-related protein n=3 Tax=Plasmodium knowlesi TaxID=5850 RepID=A0A5K1UGG9_PLAKH|nr:von Willebrand factor A domain-related protein [Plasmodium knowlesi strain H]OTN68644.1 von Willebrand factor A domain-related protein [Plasmodium knowlesi]CAA9986257.1 von Willebrand factor A domain-related protein [Plasmodium knowlesi strain H]SBO25467.1 von Willebrand factor A domain-related protein [Plasmodium knowlesi strain H]SBO27745.1 von Willebrand factor A domain-related protein [Plasmodium knowlesi strain H]VVS75731.1 von Willebrand factor A domain-related protein [Plasmodium kno|eukprot:XP_002257666.1 von willebrand factor a-domain-related protein [Plasmodium knowlesi strain H]